MVFGDAVLNITDVCMDFEPCFKVYKLVSVCQLNIDLHWFTLH